MNTERATTGKASKNSEAAPEYTLKISRKGRYKLIVMRYKRNKLAMAGMIVFIIMLAAVFSAPLYIDYSRAITQHIIDAFQSPGGEYLFGTDQFGRDLFARVIYGGRISLGAGLATVAISFIGGIVLGGVAGYFGGKIDSIIMRICDMLMAIPGTMLAMAIVAALGAGLDKLLISLAIVQIPGSARMIRAAIMNLRNSEFIEAARCYGTGSARIIFKHLLPNILGPLIVTTFMSLGTVILCIAAMGYLGIGVQAPTPEWGSIISENQSNIRYYPYLGLIPGLFIMIAVLSLSFIGDGLRDALDPKMKN